MTMARGLLGAGAYLPRSSDGTVRVRGWDEDAVTMTAAAIERVEAVDGGEEAPARVHLVGDVAGLGAPELAAILGAPAELGPPAGEGDRLEAALRAAVAGAGRHWVVVVAADGTAQSPHAGPGDGAAALLFGDGPGAEPFSVLPRREEGPLGRLFAASRSAPGAPSWVGDWAADPRLGPPAPSRSAGVDRLETTVSQGAFVSAPRDEESRAARWRFVADHCPACGTTTFPPRGRCRGCRRSDGLSPERLPLNGATVVASTWIGPGGQPTEFDLPVEACGGYGVVVAEVAKGIRVTLAVIDATAEQVRVGARVDTELRRIYPIEGAWRYGRKAVAASTPPEGESPRRRDAPG